MNKYLTTFIFSTIIPSILFADDREVTEEQQVAISGANEVIPSAQPKRPAKLPDLTKGDSIPPQKKGPLPWSLGPTGIIGIMVGGFGGDQIQVQTTRKGSPSEGKFLFGDCLLYTSPSPRDRTRSRMPSSA